MGRKFITYNGVIVGNGGLTLLSTETDTPTPPSFTNTKSILLDGVDDRIECSSLTAYDNSDFSVSIWVKKTTSGLEYVVSNSSATAKAGFDIIINSLNVNFQRRTRTKQAATGYISIGFSYNTWHHLVGTYNDTTDDLKLYLDGVLKNTSTTSADVNSASVDLRIGCSAVNSLPFQGGIDEVSLFNSELSQSDITTIYNSGAPNDISSLSPLSWWRCGDGDTSPTLTDNGSGGNDGTMTNFSTFSTDVPFSTRSIALDGVDDFVTMGDVLDFERTSAFSISCWFKRTRNGVSEFLVSKQDSTSNSRGYTLLIPFDDNKVTVVIRNNTASSGRLIVDCSTAITNTNWHHIVMTYDGSSSVSGINLYLDGNNDTGVTSGTLSATISNSASFQIGAKNGGNEFSGNIDEVSIFNSELSASDVTTIYNGGTPNDISSLSPLSWWRCGDGDTSPTLTDNGSGGNDGTMTNFTTFSTDVP